MILDEKHAISRHPQYFVAAGDSMQRTLGEGKTEENEVPLICCGSVYFLVRKKKRTTKAITCRSPLPGTLLKAAHPTVVLIL